MVKRTRFQQALVAMGACASGRRFVGKLSLRDFWRKSRRVDPTDEKYGYRTWLIDAVNDSGYEPVLSPCTFLGCPGHPDPVKSPCPSMKHVLDVAANSKSS